MRWMNQMCQAALLCVGLVSLQSIGLAESALPQFAHCIEKKQCAALGLSSGESLACCKACLGSVHFCKQKPLQKMMHEHLDLVCAQFHNPPQNIANKHNKPFTRLLLTGEYEHTSGKNGCNRDRIMWTAPVDLYIDGNVISGARSEQNGTIKVYPLARCEDRQIGDVLSNDQLQVKVMGKKMARSNQLGLVFNIAKSATLNAQHTQYFVDIISELASLSFNVKNQTLNQWSLSSQAVSQNQVQSFSTNDKAREHGWSGKTEVFISSA